MQIEKEILDLTEQSENLLDANVIALKQADLWLNLDSADSDCQIIEDLNLMK